MKRTLLISFLASAFITGVAACSAATPVAPVPTISLEASDRLASSVVKASAVVVPAQETRLSFVISGLVENVNVEVGDQVQAEQQLVMLDTSELKYDVIEMESALASAEIDAHLQRQFRRKFNFDTFNFYYESSPGEKIQIADFKVAQLEFALEAAKGSLDQAILTAPLESTIVAVNVSTGEFVSPGQVVIELARLDNLLIETTDLSELNIAAVKSGQSAIVYIEALDEEFSGEVTAISPISNTIGGDVVFKVTIQLDDQPADLLWGMSADVEIGVE